MATTDVAEIQRFRNDTELQEVSVCTRVGQTFRLFEPRLKLTLLTFGTQAYAATIVLCPAKGNRCIKGVLLLLYSCRLESLQIHFRFVLFSRNLIHIVSFSFCFTRLILCSFVQPTRLRDNFIQSNSTLFVFFRVISTTVHLLYTISFAWINCVPAT